MSSAAEESSKMVAGEMADGSSTVDVDQLFREISEWPQVEAIALGGSRATGMADAKSDYDVYVYVRGDVPESERRQLFGKYCRRLEIGNSYWENEDNGTLNDGVDIDILWRNLDGFIAEVSAVIEDGKPSNAYTTSLWHNLVTSTILFDRDGRLTAAKERFSVGYPDELRNNIIDRNMKLLHGSLPAYDQQIAKAAARGDLVAVNHRVAAFLETYFDVLFALNRVGNPGEKRMIQQAMTTCSILPNDFRDNLLALFGSMFASDPSGLNQAVEALVNELEKTVAENR